MWTKEPAPWLAEEVVDPKACLRDCSAGPVETLEAQRLLWKGHWRAEEAQPADEGFELLCKRLDHLYQYSAKLKPITGDQVVRVSATFKQSTTRPGGLHPRFPGWCSGGGAACAQLLNQAERLGNFPGPERGLTIGLHRKPKGGRHPIAGFKALYRVWGRLRKGYLQKWEAQHSNLDLFNTGKGRQCSDAVWRCEVRVGRGDPEEQ